MTHVARYVPAKTNQGWSVVVLVFALAAACIVGVTVIHKRTYKHPTDPTSLTVNGKKAAAPQATH
jgi:hypothetical protein